jgi:hypothetical protein
LSSQSKKKKKKKKRHEKKEGGAELTPILGVGIHDCWLPLLGMHQKVLLELDAGQSATRAPR